MTQQELTRAVAHGFNAVGVEASSDHDSITVSGVKYWVMLDRRGRLMVDYDRVPRPNSPTVVARVQQLILNRMADKLADARRETELEREAARQEVLERRVADLAKIAGFHDAYRSNNKYRLQGRYTLEGATALCAALAVLRRKDATADVVRMARALLVDVSDELTRQAFLDACEECFTDEVLLEALCQGVGR